MGNCGKTRTTLQFLRAHSNFPFRSNWITGKAPESTQGGEGGRSSQVSQLCINTEFCDRSWVYSGRKSLSTAGQLKPHPIFLGNGTRHGYVSEKKRCVYRQVARAGTRWVYCVEPENPDRMSRKDSPWTWRKNVKRVILTMTSGMPRIAAGWFSGTSCEFPRGAVSAPTAPGTFILH